VIEFVPEADAAVARRARRHRASHCRAQVSIASAWALAQFVRKNSVGNRLNLAWSANLAASGEVLIRLRRRETGCLASVVVADLMSDRGRCQAAGFDVGHGMQIVGDVVPRFGEVPWRAREGFGVKVCRFWA